jgi:hypothetical protein
MQAAVGYDLRSPPTSSQKQNVGLDTTFYGSDTVCREALWNIMAIRLAAQGSSPK